MLLHDYSFLILLILDGFGIRKSKHGNAIKNASLPCYKYLWKNFPHTTLKASGTRVGLPKKQMGNSEVGHMNIGTGRIIKQTLTIIDENIKNKKIYKEFDYLQESSLYLKKNNSSIMHIMGLISPGGIHSHINHLYEILNFFVVKNIENKIYLHLFTDGRDYKVNGAIYIVKKIDRFLKQNNLGIIASICGRYYAMDRDKKYERTLKAFEEIIGKKNEIFLDPVEYIKNQYEKGITDEFIIPASYKNRTKIKDNDIVLNFNFRPDRSVQITELFILEDKKIKYNIYQPKLALLITMTQYIEDNRIKVLFPKDILKNSLGECLEKNNLKQLRIAETEKFPHVTYFFNGENKKKYKGETRILVKSPNVDTYDLKPEMSVFEIKKNLLEQLQKKIYDVCIVNFANADMVGHTGNFSATIKAVEAVDICLDELYQYCLKNRGLLTVTADHGNADFMLDKNNINITTHSLNDVPFIICDKRFNLRKNCNLSDITPTILELFQIKQPKEMDGKSILKFTQKTVDNNYK